MASSEEAEFEVSQDEEHSKESESEWQDSDSSISSSNIVHSAKGDDEAWRDGSTPRRSSRLVSRS